MSELFPEEEVQSLSPADQWAKDNGITVYFDEAMALPHIAWSKDRQKTQAHTKEGALLAMANKLKITFYR